VIALEDSQVRVMTVRRLEPMASSVSGLREALYRHFVGSMLRDRNHIVQLGVLNARQRLALFLLDLSERFAAAGGAADVFELPMLRADIGSYLGLALESVSRAFSALQQQGVIRVRQRRIELRDMPALRSLAMEGPIVPVVPEAGTPIAQ
jgi:CRP/FNR family transcriptional regulator, anaerobic regulatory protein